ncbi:TRAP transporter large permease subunit [Chloroflexota bacterium]
MTKVLKTIDNGFDKLISATGLLAIGMMLLLAILVFFLTFTRYVLHINIVGLFDGAVYSLIVFPFLTAAYTMREGRHISVDIFTTRLPERARAILNVAVYLVSLIYVIILGWQAWRWAANLFSHQALTEASFMVQKGIFPSIIAFGCFLLVLQIIRQLVHSIQSLPSQTSSSRLRDNPWLYVSLFLIGIIASIVLFIHVNTGAGIILLAIVVLFSGMPVFLALGLIGVLGIYFLLGPASFLQIPIAAFKAVDSFTLTCLPLFILGGLIMEGSGIAEDIFRFFQLWTGRFAASTLLVTIIVGMVFCAISGSSTAVTAVIAGVALPVLISRRFNKALSCGAVAGATVGTLIPPSIGYVIYGVLADESVGALFMAGLIPSIILFGFYFLYVIIRSAISKKSIFERGQIPAQISIEQITWRDRLSSLKTAAWGLLTPVIILGGIYLGVYTPTEAAGVLVIYAILVSIFVKKSKWQDIIKSTLRGVLVSAMIVCIIFSAYIFALVISQLRVAPSLVAYAEASGLTSFAVLMIIFTTLIILGMFLEAASVKVITLPIFYPMAMSVGINSLWLGVFYQIIMEIGLLTPPVGLNLFVLRGVTGIPLGTIIRGCLPFILMMVLTLVIIYVFPELVTWLPGTMR